MCVGGGGIITSQCSEVPDPVRMGPITVYRKRKHERKLELLPEKET